MKNYSGIPSADYIVYVISGEFKLKQFLLKLVEKQKIAMPEDFKDFKDFLEVLGIEHGSLKVENTARWRMTVSIRKNHVSHCVTTVRETPQKCLEAIIEWSLYL